MKYTFIKTNADGTEEVVKHYGVLGMKWGVRRNPALTYARTELAGDRRKKKGAKLQAKAAKAQLKAAKYMAKGKTGSKKGMAKWGRLQAKAAKRQMKASKYELKTQKLKAKRDKLFENTRTKNMPKKDLEIMKRYDKALREQMVYTQLMGPLVGAAYGAAATKDIWTDVNRITGQYGNDKQRAAYKKRMTKKK